jgi:hypothetical protein
MTRIPGSEIPQPPRFAAQRPALPARPLPMIWPIGSWFIPVIYHPERTVEYLRFRRFRRKAKATPGEALAYAERVLWHRERRAAEKRRRLEALQHPRYERRAA